LCFVLLAQNPGSTGPLKVSLTAESQHIVEREPIKLAVEIKNVSNAPVPVVAIDELQSVNPMEHVLLRFRVDHGRTVWRQDFGTATDCGFKSPNYAGVPLPAGGIIRFNLYPNLTGLVDSTGAMLGEPQPTFAHHGHYLIRAAYFVPSVYKTLHDRTGSDGMVLSNEIEIDVDEASKDDKAVLDILWRSDGVAEEGFDRGLFSEESLRRVLLRQADSKVLAHARFALARSLQVSRSPEAVDILKELRRGQPQFRDEEVSYNLARAAIDNGEWALAAQTMTDLVARKPELKNSFKIAQLYLMAVDHSTELFGDWIEQRNDGKTPDFTQLASVHK
jgi:hypothetical protein